MELGVQQCLIKRRAVKRGAQEVYCLVHLWTRHNYGLAVHESQKEYQRTIHYIQPFFETQKNNEIVEKGLEVHESEYIFNWKIFGTNWTGFCWDVSPLQVHRRFGDRWYMLFWIFCVMDFHEPGKHCTFGSGNCSWVWGFHVDETATCFQWISKNP